MPSSIKGIGSGGWNGRGVLGLLVLVAACGHGCGSSKAGSASAAGDGGSPEAGAEAGGVDAGGVDGGAGFPSGAAGGAGTAGEPGGAGGRDDEPMAGGQAGAGAGAALAGAGGSETSQHVIGRGAVQVAVGLEHTCVRLEGGAARCWGWGTHGNLGYANPYNIGDDELPASAGDIDVGGEVTQIAAMRHTCAILATGALRCWGFNQDGYLGNGGFVNIGDNETPASVAEMAIGGTVTEVALATDHSCAILSTGGLRCWGYGASGALGYANTNAIGDDETPASAGNVAVGGTVTHVAASYSQTCAVLSTGQVRCWGTGVLGSGNLNPNQPAPVIGDNETPASIAVVNVGGKVSQIVTGNAHICVLLESGAVRCWGRRAILGYGDGGTEIIGDDETPASAGDVDVGGKVTQLAAGDDHTCALLEGGTVRCWGNGTAGQLGYAAKATIGDDETPASVGDVDVGGKVVQIAAGSQNTCALLASSAVRCWGANFYGQLGHANTLNIGDDETPASAGDVQY